MSDNLRRYRAIRDALTQGYPGQPTGTVARHLTTLAALISGIVGSKRSQLPSVATKIPDGTKPDSCSGYLCFFFRLPWTVKPREYLLAHGLEITDIVP